MLSPYSNAQRLGRALNLTQALFLPISGAQALAVMPQLEVRLSVEPYTPCVGLARAGRCDGGLKHVGAVNRDGASGTDRNDAAITHVAKLATYGFCGEAEVVGHIRARERQLDEESPGGAGRMEVLFTGPACHPKKEGCDPLLCCHATEECHPVLRLLKLIGDALEEPTLHAPRLDHEIFDNGARK